MKDKPVILVVDDQPQNIELLEAHLIPQGYEVVKAASGEEALEKLSGNQIDLVLLDVMMPRMSGFEVLKKIRADKKTRLIPVVMITVLKETEDRVKALEAGCDDFISKTFDRHELLVRAKSLLRIKSLHDDADEARDYAESIINTVREPLIALDHDLRVVKVSRSFYEFFKVKPEETVGQLIYDLGNKQWDIPRLRTLLEDILPKNNKFDDYEVEHIFSNIGHKIMLFNAQCFQYNSTSCPVNGKTGAQCACIFTGKHKGRLFDPINTHLYFVLTLEPLNDSYIHERRRYPFKEKAIIVIIAKNICKRRFYNV